MSVIQDSAAIAFVLALGKRLKPGRDGEQMTTEVRTPSFTLAFKANAQQLLALAEKRAVQCVTGKGDVLKYAVLLVSVREGRQIAGAAKGSRKAERLPSAEDNKTSIKDGRSYRHVAHRCSAYDRTGLLEPINALSV